MRIALLLNISFWLFTGVAGLILSHSKYLDLNLTNDDIRNVIRVTADDKGPTGFDNEYGYGRVNAYEALKLISAPNLVEHGTKIGGSSSLFWDSHTHTFFRGNGYSCKRCLLWSQNL